MNEQRAAAGKRPDRIRTAMGACARRYAAAVKRAAHGGPSPYARPEHCNNYPPAIYYTAESAKQRADRTPEPPA